MKFFIKYLLLSLVMIGMTIFLTSFFEFFFCEFPILLVPFVGGGILLLCGQGVFLAFILKCIWEEAQEGKAKKLNLR